MKELIEKWLQEDSQVLDAEYLPIESYKKIFESLGFKYLNEEFDTNGWQIDFWAYFEKEETRIMLAGSFYYGEFKLTKE